MSLLIIGLAIFLGVHSLAIIVPDMRDALRARLGEGSWKALYSAASLVGFVLLCKGFAQARLDPVVLYTPPPWLRDLAVVLLLPVFPLALASGLPGRIRSAVRHPLLAGVKLWCLAHLLANGQLADLVLFGSFLAWAVIDRISLKGRASQAAPALPAGPWNDAIAVIGGLVLYGAMLAWGHRWLIGVAPLG